MSDYRYTLAKNFLSRKCLRMKPIPERQNVDAALTVWARAERDQQGVVSDDNGTIELLYSSVRQQAPEISAALTRHAVQQVVGKIHSEV
jgi:hypothetical protein